jgi:hypothetical protein
VRFLGDCSIDGEGRAGGGCGVGVPAGESLGDNSELISILSAWGAVPNSYTRDVTRDAALLSSPTFTSIQDILCTTFRSVANYSLSSLDVRVANGMRRRGATLRKGASVSQLAQREGGLDGYRMRR